MYRLTLAAATAAAVVLMSYANTANAADTYPARTRAEMDRLFDSVQVQPYNWTGFYVGGNVGYGRGQLRNDDPYGIGDIGTKGWTIGATAGYNWQFARRWVIGLETDFNWANIGGSQSRDLCPGCGSFSYVETMDVKTPWFGTTRARLGFLPWQDLMVYATGGVAYGKVNSTDTYAYSYTSWWGNYSGSSTTSNSRFQVGWAAGAGAEYAINRNWSAKVEYIHLDLGDTSNTYTCTGCTAQTITTRARDDIVRAGLNYKF